MSLSYNKKYSLAQLASAPSPKKLFNDQYAFYHQHQRYGATF